jgi:ATP-dependent exoDNAse (exonuclease V) beta subunit
MKNNDKYYETPIGKLPSVTTILRLLEKPALLNWKIKMVLQYIEKHLQEIKEDKINLNNIDINEMITEAKKEPIKISQEAMDIGSRVHSLIEEYYKRKITTQNNGKYKSIEVDNQCKMPFNAFLNWDKQNDITPLETEQIIWSNKGYAGTLDLVCLYQKKLFIIDFKTSRSFWNEYILQISAYKKAYIEQTGKKIKGIGILRLDKETGMPEFRDYTTEYKKNIKIFLDLVKVWKGLKGGK